MTQSDDNREFEQSIELVRECSQRLRSAIAQHQQHFFRRMWLLLAAIVSSIGLAVTTIAFRLFAENSWIVGLFAFYFTSALAVYALWLPIRRSKRRHARQVRHFAVVSRRMLFDLSVYLDTMPSQLASQPRKYAWQLALSDAESALMEYQDYFNISNEELEGILRMRTEA